MGAPPNAQTLGAVQLLWDRLGHHSLWIIPYFPSRSSTDFLNFKCRECSIHCSTKPYICAFFHIAGKLSHFPRMSKVSANCEESSICKVTPVTTRKNSWILRTLRKGWEKRGKGVNISWNLAKCQALEQVLAYCFSPSQQASEVDTLIPLFQMRKQSQKGWRACSSYITIKWWILDSNPVS